jgi:hypothetical protein
MKTNLLFLLGLGLAAMAAVAAHSAWKHGWDLIELVIAVGLLAGSVAVLRAGGRAMDSTKPPV